MKPPVVSASACRKALQAVEQIRVAVFLSRTANDKLDATNRWGPLTNRWGPLLSLMRTRLRLVHAGGLAVVLMLSLPRAGLSEVMVKGNVHSATVEAQEASVADVFDALSTELGLRIHTSSTIDQVISGTYQGSVQQIVSRVLVGRNYITKHFPGNIEIMILAPSDAPVVYNAPTRVVPLGPGMQTSVARRSVRARPGAPAVGGANP